MPHDLNSVEDEAECRRDNDLLRPVQLSVILMYFGCTFGGTVTDFAMSCPNSLSCAFCFPARQLTAENMTQSCKICSLIGNDDCKGSTLERSYFSTGLSPNLRPRNSFIHLLSTALLNAEDADTVLFTILTTVRLQPMYSVQPLLKSSASHPRSRY